MPGIIDHNMFITFFWAFFFSSLAVTAVKLALKFILQGASAVYELIIGKVDKAELRAGRFVSGLTSWKLKNKAEPKCEAAR